MSDKPEKAEKKEKKPKEEAAVEDYSPKATAKGSNWTLEKCQKVARRFSSLQEWQTGAPASYKSAAHHNWVEKCMPGSRKSRVA